MASRLSERFLDKSRNPVVAQYAITHFREF